MAQEKLGGSPLSDGPAVAGTRGGRKSDAGVAEGAGTEYCAPGELLTSAGPAAAEQEVGGTGDRDELVTVALEWSDGPGPLDRSRDRVTGRSGGWPQVGTGGGVLVTAAPGVGLAGQ